MPRLAHWSSMSGDELELRVAWERHLGGAPASMRWFESVLRRHRAPDRHYHGVRHVRWVVRHVTELSARHSVDDPDAVVAAAFFHDAVYDPTAADNEAASARLATTALRELDWTTQRCDRVAAMIAATAAHDVGSADLDTAVLLAADLAVLAAEPARYADYVRGVRREYCHLEERRWRPGRAAVLRALAAQPRLFADVLGLNDWELRARANIAAELASLGD